MTERTRFISRRARQAISRDSLGGHLDIAVDPAFAKHPDDPLAEPVKWSFWRNRRRQEEVRVTLSRYEGRPVVSVWVFFTTQDGRMQPSKKGLVLAASKLPELRKALELAEAKALDIDLIEAAE